MRFAGSSTSSTASLPASTTASMLRRLRLPVVVVWYAGIFEFVAPGRVFLCGRPRSLFVGIDMWVAVAICVCVVSGCAGGLCGSGEERMESSVAALIRCIAGLTCFLRENSLEVVMCGSQSHVRLVTGRSSFSCVEIEREEASVVEACCCWSSRMRVAGDAEPALLLPLLFE